MHFEHDHSHWMRYAIELASKGQYTAAPNPLVGAVIVKDDKILGEGFHERPGLPHAEINAIHDALAQGYSLESFKKSTLYVTLEPCSHYGRTPPCCESITAYGFQQVVIAIEDPNPLVSGRGIQWLQQKGVNVVYDIESSKAFDLNRSFFYSMRKNRPFTSLKIAASMDGKTSLANGVNQWITGPESRSDVHLQRSLHQAIVTGKGTFIADNPRLTVRDLSENHQFFQHKGTPPRRFLVDTQGISILKSQYHQYHLLKKSHQVATGVFVDQAHYQQLNALLQQKSYHDLADHIELIPLKTINERIDLQDLQRYLQTQSIQSLYVEAGACLAGAFIEQELVDEIHLYLAPKFFGPQGRTLLSIPNLEHLNENNHWSIVNHETFGKDLKICLRKLEQDTFIQKYDQISL